MDPQFVNQVRRFFRGNSGRIPSSCNRSGHYFSGFPAELGIHRCFMILFHLLLGLIDTLALFYTVQRVGDSKVLP
jgi:hypothetical protein